MVKVSFDMYFRMTSTGSLITYPSKVDAFLGLMELDQNNKLDDFVISRYESFTVPNQKFNQTINYINIERSMKNFFFGIFLGFSTRYTIVALDQIQKSNFF